MSRRSYAFFAVLATVFALIVTRYTVARPGYTDAFYYYNAAERLVTGEGLTDAYVWTYIGAGDELPFPSNAYWMPMASLVAAVGMWIFGVGYGGAQMPFALMWAGVAVIGFWLGWRLGKTSRAAWVAGLLVLFSGFYFRFWGMTSSFAPYGLFGAGCLLAVGLGLTTSRVGWFGLAGVCAALGHLTRADGIVLLMAAVAALLWPWGAPRWRVRVVALAVLFVAYFVAMTPWFARSLSAFGAPLPTGGAQGVWFSEYNDIFNYPPDASPETFLQAGVLWSSRWEALRRNAATFFAVEGWVALWPFMLLALWNRRRDPFLRGLWLYALGMHTALTLVFPFPGMRGGVFHSASALVPWWAALAVCGIDDAVTWAAARRSTWNAPLAKFVFSVGAVVLAVVLSGSVAASRVADGTPRLYRLLDETLPADARIMVNDPAQMYYFTGRGGVVLPNESPAIIPEIAARYDVGFLLLEQVNADGLALAAPTGLIDIPADPPDFLQPIPLDDPRVRLYAITDPF